jgi:hypothetical protein
LFRQQTKTWIDQHLSAGLDNYKIESFQPAGALQKLLSELNFRLGDDSCIEHDSPIFRTLYYRDIINCIQYRLAHFGFQAHRDFAQVGLSDSEGRQIYSKTNTGDW